MPTKILALSGLIELGEFMFSPFYSTLGRISLKLILEKQRNDEPHEEVGEHQIRQHFVSFEPAPKSFQPGFPISFDPTLGRETALFRHTVQRLKSSVWRDLHSRLYRRSLPEERELPTPAAKTNESQDRSPMCQLA